MSPTTLPLIQLRFVLRFICFWRQFCVVTRCLIKERNSATCSALLLTCLVLLQNYSRVFQLHCAIRICERALFLIQLQLEISGKVYEKKTVHIRLYRIN